LKAACKAVSVKNVLRLISKIMRFIYNVAQLLLAPLIVLLLPVYLIIRPEKRKSIFPRLGFGLDIPEERKKTIIWIHALSVGEITSAYQLVRQLHQEKKDSSTLVFSASTTSGYQLANRIISPYSDACIYYPYDFLPAVNFFINRIKPDVFILIETDFWPNFVHCLANRQVPLLLFNGRISADSIKNYRRFSFFFKPLFDQFALLCMQTAIDSQRMHDVGISKDKTRTLGNLKFANIDCEQPDTDGADSPFPTDKLIIIAGSTHAGEEQMMADAFLKLNSSHSSLYLVIGPRNIVRCNEIKSLLEQKDLRVGLFSKPTEKETDVTIVDTIGDLSMLYRFADISFIGGSMVPEGGHNPLEAARLGCSVLFGPHMTDFSEISDGLLDAEGAVEVVNETELYDALETLISSSAKRAATGENGKRFTASHQDIIGSHIQVINQYL